MTDRALTSRQTALLFAISAVGIFLRFAAIDRSYWFDELVTVSIVNRPDWSTVLLITSRDNQPPLYNSAIFAWTHAFGFSEIAVRSFSLIIGLLALLTPWLAQRTLNRDEKLLSFTILCLMTLPIRYAQEARNYSLLFLFSSVCLYSYLEILTTKSRRLQVLFHFSLILLAFTHLFGLLLAVSFLAVMFWRDRRITHRLAVIVYAVALSAAIIIPLLRGGSGEKAGGNFWLTFSAASLSRQLLTVFTPVGIVLLASAAISWWRTSGRARFDPSVAQAIAPFILMFIGAIAISFNTPILTDRNLIGLIPAFALFTAWFLNRVLLRSPAVISFTLLCLLLVQAVALTYSPYLFIQQDFRSIAKESVASNRKVCYVMPNSTTKSVTSERRVPFHLFSFYTATIFDRPDLEPESLALSEVPTDLASRDCSLWAAPTLPKRGVSVLRTLPQFSGCSDVQLAGSRARLGSELLDCRPPA